jgi:hypothetical protein
MMNRLALLATALSLACAAHAAQAVTGQVAETMDSGGYTYARVVQGGASVWTAVPRMRLKAGDAVSFQSGMVMVDYKSPTLGRTFDRIVFSQGPTGPAPRLGAPAARKAASVKTAKASGPDARTISEVYAQRAELAGKTASVRGKVVKINRAIMDRNWVHLQDGSGDAQAGDFELVVATQGDAKLGETLTAAGTVAKDRDLGMGYKYPVLLEKASLSR